MKLLCVLNPCLEPASSNRVTDEVTATGFKQRRIQDHLQPHEFAELTQNLCGEETKLDRQGLLRRAFSDSDSRCRWMNCCQILCSRKSIRRDLGLNGYVPEYGVLWSATPSQLDASKLSRAFGCTLSELGNHFHTHDRNAVALCLRLPREL